MKLSKQKTKLHNECEEILKKDVLTFDDKLFVIENWQEGAKNMNGQAGAFFTPILLARDFNLEIGDGMDIVDLCAGIGVLSFHAIHWKKCNVTCIELNEDYVRVGKKILPEATWIQGSIIDEELIKSLPKFDQSISNPPFGKIKTSGDKSWLKYKGSEFEYITIYVASKISSVGTFLIPQMSTPYRYSGNQGMGKRETSSKLKKFIKETNFDLEFNVGIDTSYHVDDWNGVSPICEIINIEFPPQLEQSKLEL